MACFLVIALMCASAAFVWEPWPFTSFRLFSTNRTSTQGSWETRAELADGLSVPVRIEDLPNGFRGFAFTMNEFGALQTEYAICQTWIEATEGALGTDVRSLVISRRTWDLEKGATRTSGFAEDPEWICTDHGAIPAEEPAAR